MKIHFPVYHQNHFFRKANPMGDSMKPVSRQILRRATFSITISRRADFKPLKGKVDKIVGRK